MRREWVVLAGAAALWGCTGGGGTPPEPAAPAGGGGLAAVEAEIFVPKCARGGCHAGANASGGLDLSRGQAHASTVGVHAERRPERLLVSPGDPEASYLVERIVEGGDRPLMPLGGKPLSEAEVEAVREWIRGGARP